MPERQPLTERELLVYRRLSAAADRGDPCPGNSTIMLWVGAESTGLPSKIVADLAAKGWIEIWRGKNARVIRIVETGRRTAGSVAAMPQAPATETSEQRRLRYLERDRERRRLTKEQREADGDMGDLASRLAASRRLLEERRAEQLRWLDREQQRYQLPVRARHIEEMPA